MDRIEVVERYLNTRPNHRSAGRFQPSTYESIAYAVNNFINKRRDEINTDNDCDMKYRFQLINEFINKYPEFREFRKDAILLINEKIDMMNVQLNEISDKCLKLVENVSRDELVFVNNFDEQTDINKRNIFRLIRLFGVIEQDIRDYPFHPYHEWLEKISSLMNFAVYKLVDVVNESFGKEAAVKLIDEFYETGQFCDEEDRNELVSRVDN